MKKQNEAFDVTMRSYDGAEVCELVGLFILSELTNLMDKNSIGSYRDDGLAILKNCSEKAADKMRKDVIGIFRQYGLRITCDIGLRQVYFLDLTLNLSTGKYWSYRKPDDNLLYIDARSNHPSKIINQLPKMIAARVSINLCNSEEFDKVKPDFEEALE